MKDKRKHLHTRQAVFLWAWLFSCAVLWQPALQPLVIQHVALLRRSFHREGNMHNKLCTLPR